MMDPAASDEPMAPCRTPLGFSKYSTYWSVTTMADMDEMSKPKSIPPSVATQASR
jgi:hypothetical protein